VSGKVSRELISHNDRHNYGLADYDKYFKDGGVSNPRFVYKHPTQTGLRNDNISNILLVDAHKISKYEKKFGSPNDEWNEQPKHKKNKNEK
jgi:hypothetical protein